MSGPVFEVKKPCPNPNGCACIGTCQETMEVVAAADYWRLIGERDSVASMLQRWVRQAAALDAENSRLRTAANND